MLDDTMTYSSAVLDHPDEALETAQARKYRLLAEKARTTLSHCFRRT
jgi:cyclopropane fatty-acyl-phospholipid synthase-like methyltransferase